MTCHFVPPFSLAMQVLCRLKETQEKKRLVHQNMHSKAILKPGISEIAKVFRHIVPGPHKEGLTEPHMNPQLQG